MDSSVPVTIGVIFLAMAVFCFGLSTIMAVVGFQQWDMVVLRHALSCFSVVPFCLFISWGIKKCLDTD